MRKPVTVIFMVSLLLVSGFALKTRHDLLPLPGTLVSLLNDVDKCQVVDRHGMPLTRTYQNRWNSHDCLPLHELPEFLKKAFVIAEDKRFHEHRGVDWRARVHALWQNLSSLRTVRGASTITEQVIRMIHPRPRTLWARWLEGFEAASLERVTTKADILEFYLNQVPYAANHRGVVQAARYYFNRDMDTLSRKEMIALAVLVRAPSYLDLYARPDTILPLMEDLCARLQLYGMLTWEEYRMIQEEKFNLARPVLPVDAGHFIHYLYSRTPQDQIQHRQKLYSTLDSHLQNQVQNILDQQLTGLKNSHVMNGAAIVVEHTHNTVLAWVNGGKGNPEIPGALVDGVLSLRQPGSALKPFLYGMALENGWTPATLLMDSPVVRSVGTGLHSYRNYSNLFYGLVSLREALGNSLNIPAIRTIRFVGVDNFLSRLRTLGFEHLIQHPDFYGDGLALGNGEVQLFELVQAYTVLANNGIFQPLRILQDDPSFRETRRIYSEEVSSLLADILSDPQARRLEFGPNSVLTLPVQTAVKTGTSSDYRDAWAVGFNYHYTIGVWMGNLDGSPMDGITGSRGPGVVLRSVFAELNRFEATRPLYFSNRLTKKEICDPVIQAVDGDCLPRTEWFIPGNKPEGRECKPSEKDIRLVRPTNGLQLAMDPRVPDALEAFEFRIDGMTRRDVVEWEIDDTRIRRSSGEYLWPLTKGRHNIKATVWRGKDKRFQTDEIQVSVK